MRVSVSEIFSKLFPGDADAAVRAIFSAMETKTAIVHFLYFANAERCGLFRSERRSDSDESYFRALLSADLLLPDGVALALSYLRFKRPELSALPTLFRYRKFADSSLHNLNGTDFLPKFLSSASERFWSGLSVYLYGTTEATVSQAARYVETTFGIPCGYQEGFSAFDREKFLAFGGETKILLVWRGTPKQELWVEENRTLLAGVAPTGAASAGAAAVFSVWGLFDFWGGGEKRAPECIRRMRGEWIWRLVTNPKKNFTKVVTSLKFFPRFFRGFE